MKKLFTLLTAMLCALSMTACISTAPDSEITSVPENAGRLVSHYLDVGQGDSIFIELPDKKTMLIDAGESKCSGSIITYIKNLGYKKIDYLVATHPHADHIGGMKAVVNAFDIGKIYMPDVVSTTKTYENLLLAISDKGNKITKAKAGMNISSSDSLSIDIVAPVSDSYKDMNDYSVIIKIKYFNNAFLYTGDAEALSESQITADIKADVLKVGHHGSSSSTSQKFLDKVSPSYAVISVGEGNDYGHPHKETLDRLNKKNIKIFRTDLNGTVVITSDGNNITASSQKADASSDTTPDSSDAEHRYVLNLSSKKIHRPDCSSVSKISDGNLGYCDDFEKAVKDGYTPCGTCNPS